MKRILTFTTVAFALTTSVSAQASISADSINVAQQMIIDRMDSLPEVQVKGHRPMFKMKDGELVTQVKGTPLEQETTLNDLLQRMPGMVKGRNGGLEVYGLGTPLIYINGRKATDIELKQIDVKNIKNIRLLTSPGAKYDATTGAVLEISTLRSDEGLYGRVQAWDRVNENNSMNGDLTLGWVTKKLSLTGNYTYTDYRYDVTQPQEQTLHCNEGDYFYSADRHGKDKHKIHSGNVSLDWQLSKDHVLGIQWNGSWTHGGRNEHSTQLYQYPEEQPQSFFADGKEHSTGSSQYINLFHTAQWNSKLSTAFYLDYANNKNDMTQPVDETENGTTITIDNTSSTDYDVFSGRLIADYALTKTHALSLGVEASLVDGGGNMTSTAEGITAEDYTNHEEKIAAYAQYNGRAGLWSWIAGFRYEHLRSEYGNENDHSDDITRTYNQWFPSLGLSFNGEKWRHSFSLNSKTARPSFRNLSGATYFVNRFFYQKGNPELEPATTFSAQLRSMWQDFTLTLTYSHIKNLIAYYHDVPEGLPARLVSTYMNYDKKQIASAAISWTHVFGVWRPNASLYFQRQFFNTIYMNKTFNRDGNQWTFSMNNYFTMKKGWTFSLYYYFMNGGRSGDTDFEPVQDFTLTVKKSFLNDRLVLSLRGNDIFRQSVYREKNKNGIVDFSQTEDYHERYVRLTVTYRFNQKKAKYRGKNSAEQEMNRL